MERGKVLISIVIPHRNTPEKLCRLLSSIPSLPEIEIVVIDDNSDFGKKANTLTNKFRHVRFIENPGPEYNAGSARNCGLEVVEGDWILFADADDYFIYDVSAGLVSILKSVRPGVDIVFFDVTSRNEAKGEVGVRHKRNSNLLKRYLLDGCETGLRYHWPGPVAKAIRVDLIRKKCLRFDSVIASNDVMFSQLSGHYARKVKCVNQVLYCITESDDSLTARLTPERALSRLDVMIRSNSNLMKWGVGGRVNWGATYFLKSRPLTDVRRKLPVYYKYSNYLYKRLWFQFLRVFRDAPIRY